MKVELWAIGKTSERYLEEGIGIFEKRLKHYLRFEQAILPDIRKGGKMSPTQLKAKEAEMVLQKLENTDFLVLLDERGKTYTSEAFAEFLNHKLQLSYRRIVFLIGGAFGFDDALYQRANTKWSLSALTFSHQMIRLFAIEQIYRGMTILNNEPYHNA
ncbi:23S rRNA (pseudouridine(1915)-N(3))-methyltransferase RlmH [Phaeodactylibacter luteus]|uniref:Ribosomal RNA large subunit methyltransferase H n=1 Tax=Phaeodactylibacter luteus TaxID=1564516 RepID=A0A5C6RJU8_9BACT|nr:23S rRNA (pseudouridine(1915)-N(3))-methyltransferase RlmH [Phaeodactylibacter luteus]TXB62696.1 23S rRNA (pseudouridine(1915)-N(3))-methyltransferase RlmH [Phaeodactylibacter luteus]